jgi:hypothetical protein
MKMCCGWVIVNNVNDTNEIIAPYQTVVSLPVDIYW